MELFFITFMGGGIFVIGVVLGFIIGTRITNNNWVDAVKDHSKEFKED